MNRLPDYCKHALRLTDQFDAGPLPMVLHTRVIAHTTGGPDKTVLRSAGYIDNTKMRIAAAYIHPANDPVIKEIREKARRYQCPLHEIAELGPIDLRTLRRLILLCKKQRVTVWHSHDYKTDILGLIVSRFWPMKLVSTVHGFTRENLKTRFYARLNNLALRRFDHVITVSPQLFKHCQSLGVSDDRLTYLPNAIDPLDYQPEGNRDQIRTQLGIKSGRFVIGVVGRLSVEKGVIRAVHTLARLAKNYNHLELHIIGDGAKKGEIQLRAAELGVNKRVKFWGWRDDLRPFYQSMDMLLLPSHTEGLPNAVLEAMASGAPAAATDVGGVRELLNWGACGVILDKNDELSWSSQIAPLIVSAERRTELANRALQRIEMNYSFQMRMEKVTAIYDNLLKIAPAPTVSTTELRQAA